MLTTQTHAPYNRLEMSVDDLALDATIRRHEERLARDPTSLAFAQLADLYRKAGRTREAVAVCRNGLARYPQYTTARVILAASPKDAQCHRLAAEIQRRLGHIDRAVTHLEAAVRLDPGDRESRSLLGLLRATTPAAGEASGLQRVLRRHVRDSRLRHALPRAGLRRGGRPGVHPNPPEGSRQPRRPRAPGDDAPRTGATERLERDAGVNRGVQEGVAHRLRWPPVHDRGV